jgi:hypothetical protein
MTDISRIWWSRRLRSRAARVAGVPLLATAAVVGTSLSPAGGAVSPSVAAMPGELHGVWCGSASDCIAVGDYWPPAHGFGEALIERWNGSTWSIVPSPSPPPVFAHTGAELDGVTCVSAADCLTVGFYKFSRNQPGEIPFSGHWNGSKWSPVKVPGPSGASSAALSAVSCVSATDCWASGWADSKTLTEHWNGSKWAVVPSPSPSPVPGDDSVLAGMACPAAAECWAVGLDVPSDAVGTLTEQWNGTKWVAVTTPTSMNGQLAADACATRSACLAVGHGDSGFALSQLWNGSKWLAEKPVQPAGVTASAFEAVSCPGTACVAVGNDGTAGSPVVSLAEGWTGTRWTVEPTPNPSGATFTFLQGVACISATNCWAAGEWGGSATGPNTLIEHWNGSAWSITA